MDDAELERLLPGTLARRAQFEKLVREVRAFGHLFIERAALPEDLR